MLHLVASTSKARSNCPPPPSAPHLLSSFSCSKFILFLFFSYCTPLHVSAQYGHLEICRLLLQCNADIEAKNGWYLPPYYYCCFYEAKLCFRKFILFVYFSDWTPLHTSAWFGQLKVARFLVQSKADVAARTRCFSPPPLSPSFTHYVPCSWGKTALNWAIERNKENVAAYLRSLKLPRA